MNIIQGGKCVEVPPLTNNSFLEEYMLIKLRESKLSYKKRNIVINWVENNYSPEWETCSKRIVLIGVFTHMEPRVLISRLITMGTREFLGFRRNWDKDKNPVLTINYRELTNPKNVALYRKTLAEIEQRGQGDGTQEKETGIEALT